ncbi:predicted protein [Postia placenta Mad-698-R]|nr:predicted protein [Postia placenta Mad-698-R]
MSINKQLTYTQAVDSGNDSWVSDCGMEVNASLERWDSASVRYQVLLGVKHDVIDQEDAAEYAKRDIMGTTDKGGKSSHIEQGHKGADDAGVLNETAIMFARAQASSHKRELCTTNEACMLAGNIAPWTALSSAPSKRQQQVVD